MSHAALANTEFIYIEFYNIGTELGQHLTNLQDVAFACIKWSLPFPFAVLPAQAWGWRRRTCACESCLAAGAALVHAQAAQAAGASAWHSKRD